MQNQNKKITRIVAGVLVLIMLLSVLVGAFSTAVSANNTILVAAKVVAADYIDPQKDDMVTIAFRLPYKPAHLKPGESYNVDASYDLGNHNNSAISDIWAKGSMTVTASDNECNVTIHNMRYLQESKNYRFFEVSNIKSFGVFLDADGEDQEIPDNASNQRQALFSDLTIVVAIDPQYFKGPILDDDSVSSTKPDPDPVTPPTTPTNTYTYSSNIVFESASLTDQNGNPLQSVTKDSAPFQIEVTFTDTGLHHAELDRLQGTDVDAFFIPSGAFSTTGTTRGRITPVTNTASKYPRFKAEFSNVVYSGNGNDVSFEIYYLFSHINDPVKGEGKGIVPQAKPDDEESSAADKLGVAVPKMIIDQYSYGEEPITAGEEFTLNFSLQNTSSNIPLENIVVTLTPTSNAAQSKGPGLIVAASSNTIYVPALPAGGSMPYSVAFQARPDAEVTSHLIEVKFTYEYIDSQKKTREKAEMTENIAIPVSQIDRFIVDPITEELYGEIGQEIYVPVTYINKGKSITYNVTASIRTEGEGLLMSTTEHIGNVEAGASDSVEIALTANEPGDFSGEVLFTYEDENNNSKEITTPFHLVVEAPMMPPPINPGLSPEDMMPPETSRKPGALSIVLCVIGGCAIAGPVALYLMKRVKAKGSEDLDEDF